MKEKITISKVNIFPVAQQGDLVGFGSCVVNDSLRISGIALKINLDGSLKISFPAKKISRGLTFYVQPLDSQTAELLRFTFEETAQKEGLFNFGGEVDEVL